MCQATRCRGASTHRDHQERFLSFDRLIYRVAIPDFKEEIRKRLVGLKIELTKESVIIDEVAQHLEERYEELRSSGRSEEEARRAALEELRCASVNIKTNKTRSDCFSDSL